MFRIRRYTNIQSHSLDSLEKVLFAKNGIKILMITKEKIDLKGLVRRETLIQRNYSTVAFYLSVGWFLLVLQSNECFVFFVLVIRGEFLMI